MAEMTPAEARKVLARAGFCMIHLSEPCSDGCVYCSAETGVGWDKRMYGYKETKLLAAALRVLRQQEGKP